MTIEKTRVALADLGLVSAKALTNIGVSAADAKVVLPILIYAQLRGSTQGLVKIIERTVLARADARPMDITRLSPALIKVDGQGQIGMVVLKAATELLISATRESSLALATTSGTASSTGAIGYYAAQMAQCGLIGIVMAGSPKTMAVHGGVDPVMGTNPLAIAIPRPSGPLVLDMATAAVPVFGLIAARNRGETIEAGLAWNQQGDPTTDPAQALAGAIRTFGGAKGSALALMFEILTGALSGASLPGDPLDNRGNFMLGIDPEAVLPGGQFQARVESLLAQVSQSRPAQANAPVKLPGEASEQRAAEALNAGFIDIETSLWQALAGLAAA